MPLTFTQDEVHMGQYGGGRMRLLPGENAELLFTDTLRRTTRKLLGAISCGENVEPVQVSETVTTLRHMAIEGNSHQAAYFLEQLLDDTPLPEANDSMRNRVVALLAIAESLEE